LPPEALREAEIDRGAPTTAAAHERRIRSREVHVSNFHS